MMPYLVPRLSMCCALFLVLALGTAAVTGADSDRGDSASLRRYLGEAARGPDAQRYAQYTAANWPALREQFEAALETIEKGDTPQIRPLARHLEDLAGRVADIGWTAEERPAVVQYLNAFTVRVFEAERRLAVRLAAENSDDAKSAAFDLERRPLTGSPLLALALFDPAAACALGADLWPQVLAREDGLERGLRNRIYWMWHANLGTAALAAVVPRLAGTLERLPQRVREIYRGLLRYGVVVRDREPELGWKLLLEAPEFQGDWPYLYFGPVDKPTTGTTKTLLTLCADADFLRQLYPDDVVPTTPQELAAKATEYRQRYILWIGAVYVAMQNARGPATAPIAAARQELLADARKFYQNEVLPRKPDPGDREALGVFLRDLPDRLAATPAAPARSAAVPAAPPTAPEQGMPAAGKDWTAPDVGMEFVWLEALKLHVGKYEVTNGEYRKGGAGSHDSRVYKGHRLNGDRQPAVLVPVDAAIEYAARLTSRERKAGRLPVGWRYRLPTESEWQAFAQCGDNREYPWGKEMPPKYGNYCGQETNGITGTMLDKWRDDSVVSCDVEKSGRNDWGLYGVGGNVWECTANNTGGFGSWRGASWSSRASGDLECRFRNVQPVSFCDPAYGFRLVLSPGLAQGAPRVKEVTPATTPAPPGLKVPEGFAPANGTKAEPGTKTGWAQEMVHEQTGMAFVYVPAGEFLMGSPADESRRRNDETHHLVTLTKGFYLGKYEVTQGQWENVMDSNFSRFKSTGTEGPVEMVSWEGCQAFIQKLNRMLPAPSSTPPAGFRLPTEAEWEYACRAETKTAPNGGRDLTPETAPRGKLTAAGWFAENSEQSTHPVGQKQPNAWGLHDMLGNVWEWCSDWYGDYPAGAVTDPTGPAEGRYRVRRGGSFNGFVDGMGRSAMRHSRAPVHMAADLGCRLAYSLPAAQKDAAPVKNIATPASPAPVPGAVEALPVP